MGLTSLTVFVVADDEHGAQLQETMLQWSAVRWVGPSAWVTPASTRLNSFGPPEVTATFIENGVRRSEDLFQLIGKHRLNVVRVVLGRLIATDEFEVDFALQQVADAIATAIDNALPRSSREEGHTTRLWRLNVIAPVSGVRAVDPDLLLQGWTVNAVVSAEDRPDADHANVFVRDPGNAVGHAASALAAAGGVFSGIDAGIFDQLATTQSTTNGRDVVVVRVAVRAIVGDYAETRLAVRTLDAVEQDPLGATSFVEWGRDASNPDQIVGDISRHILSSDPWRSPALPPVPRSSQAEKGLGAAVGQAVRFNLKMFTVVPSWILRRGQTALEHTATNTIVGQGADTLVRFSPTTPEAMRSSAITFLSKVDEGVEDRLPRVGTPDATTWGHLRSVVFAAVDGGQLPDDIETPRYAGVREVLPAERIVADPEDVLRLRGRVLNPSDQATARAFGQNLRKDLESATAKLAKLKVSIEEAEAKVDEAKEALDAAEAEVEAVVPEKKKSQGKAAKHKADEAEDVSSDSEDTTESKGPDAEAPSQSAKNDPATARSRAKSALRAAELALERLQASLAPAESNVEQLADELETFTEWDTRVSGSVLRRVSDDVANRSSAHRERHESLRSAKKDDGAPPIELLVRTKKLVQRIWTGTAITWLVLLVLLAAVVTTAVQNPKADQDPLEVWCRDNWGLTALGITVLALVVLWLANHTYYRALGRYNWTIQREADARLRKAADIAHSGQEALRLAHLNATLSDWSAIIGQVLHHSKGKVTNLVGELTTDVVDSLPAAFAIARIERDDEIANQSIVQSVRLIYPMGWAATAFDHGYAAHQAVTMTQDAAGLIAADLDATGSEYGPRRELRRFWEDGAASQFLTAEAVSELSQAVQDGEIVLTTRRVSRLGTFSTGAVVSEPQFLHGVATADTAFIGDMFADAARVEGKQNVNRSAAWLPEDDAEELDSTSEVARHLATMGVAIRVDMSQVLSAADLVLFAEDPGFTSGAPLGSRRMVSEGSLALEETGQWA